MVSQAEKELETLKDTAKKTVETADDIQREVRDITLKALKKGNLDKDRIKAVVQAVLQGAKAGAESHGDEVQTSLAQAVKGLDEALVKTASATRLAIEEAAGQIKDYSQHEIRRAINDLQGLESTLIDVIKDVAKSSSDLVSRILHEIVEHAKNSGTAVGRQASESLSTLQSKVGQAGRDTLIEGAETAKTVSVKIARAASGFLAGLADTLESSGKSKDEEAEAKKSD